MVSDGDDQQRHPSGDDEPPPEVQAAVQAAQIALIRSTRREVVLAGLEDEADEVDGSAGFAYMYRPGHLLTRDRDLSRVRASLESRDVSHQLPPRADPSTGSPVHHAGVSVVRVTDDRSQMRVPPLMRELDDEFGPGVVTPHHVLWLAGPVTPAVEPAPVPPGSACVPPLRESGGADVHVVVVDTGFVKEGWEQRWLKDVVASAQDVEMPRQVRVQPDGSVILDAADPHIDPYVGHGTFASGVVRAIAPQCRLTVLRMTLDLTDLGHGPVPLYSGGVVDETTVVSQLTRAFGLAPDVISLQAGCYTRGNIPPLAFEPVEGLMAKTKGVALVCSAGNDMTTHPLWPGAFPWAVSVGALDSVFRGRAWYSNRGGWVDVYCPGTDLVNAFAGTAHEPVTYMYAEPRPPGIGAVREFRGLARWSGTSFSAPYFAGLVAERTAKRDVNARLAAEELLRKARGSAIDGVGPALT